jgi:CheY-like chemotaxis protein
MPANILIVDDEDTVLTTLSAVVRRFGYGVTAARTEREAVALLGAKPVDLLITDMNLGDGGDGVTVARTAKRMMPDLPVFVLTGYPAEYSPGRAGQLGATRYFTKPCNLRDLEAGIAAALSDPE